MRGTREMWGNDMINMDQFHAKYIVVIDNKNGKVILKKK